MNSWPKSSLDSLDKLRKKEILELGDFLDRRNRLLNLDKTERKLPPETELADRLEDRHIDTIQGSLAALQDYESAMRIVEMNAKGVNVDNLIYPVEG
jgi:hypothetical protein